MRSPVCLVLAVLLSMTLGGCREPGATAVPGPSDGVSDADQTPPKSESPGISDQPGKSGGLRAGALCNLEFLDGKAFDTGAAQATAQSRLRGWLGDESGNIPGSPRLVLQDADKVIGVPILLNIGRSDVAEAYPGKAGLENSGFEVSLAGASIVPGSYHVYLTYVIGSEGYLCDNGRHIVVSK